MSRRLQHLGGGLLVVAALALIPGVGRTKSFDGVSPGFEPGHGPSAGDLAKKYLTRSIAVRVVRLCNDDGSDPGTISSYAVDQGIEEANAVLYDNSGANLVFHLDPETDLGTCVHDTAANYDCHLNPAYFPGKTQTEITEVDLANLTEKDLNGDGVYDKADVQHLCDTSKQGVRRKSIAYDSVGSMVVFVRGKQQARRRVKYDDDLGPWVFVYPSGGYSSCAGNLVVMNSGWWGNLLAHEAGHYFCNPHTFSRNPKDAAQAADQIAAVVDKYDLDPSDHEKVLIYSFDGDHWSKVDFLGDHRIFDTPPDPRGSLWKSEFGSDVCLPENDLVSVHVPELGETYDLRPDRSLVMSYFKGCTALGQHFSPDQVERIEVSLDHHRQHLVDQNVVDCYYAKYDATDWTTLGPEQAFAKKDHDLSQCQSKPDLGNLRQLAKEKLYPKPKPIPEPRWSDPVMRASLEVMEIDEIEEEITLDLQMEAAAKRTKRRSLNQRMLRGALRGHTLPR